MTTTGLITDFGVIALGPKFAAVFTTDGLNQRKSSKAYKAAKAQADLTTKAFCLMHQACYMAGVDMQEDTP